MNKFLDWYSIVVTIIAFLLAVAIVMFGLQVDVSILIDITPTEITK